MPAMNAARSPVMATPSTPVGRYLFISPGMASLYGSPPDSPIPGSSSTAAMPGMTIANGMKIFGNEPTIGVSRAALSSFADIARCTSAKLVVQYPNDRQNDRPNTSPTQSPIGLSPPNPRPDQGGGKFGPLTDSFWNRPSMPPTSFSAMITTGISPAQITKNCITSL